MTNNKLLDLESIPFEQLCKRILESYIDMHLFGARIVHSKIPLHADLDLLSLSRGSELSTIIHKLQISNAATVLNSFTLATVIFLHAHLTMSISFVGDRDFMSQK